MKQYAVNQLLQARQPHCRVELVTTFNAATFHRQASDISALHGLIAQGSQVLRNDLLHAKIYIFDDTAAVVTSANFTYGGWQKNLEYGVVIEEKYALEEVSQYYQQLATTDKDNRISESDCQKVKSLIDNLPRQQRVPLPRVVTGKDIEKTKAVAEVDKLSVNVEAIAENLSGELKFFILLIARLPDAFDLQQVYNLKPHYKVQYPNNNNVEAKMRQLLQRLREHGLLIFMGRGTYQKLF